MSSETRGVCGAECRDGSPCMNLAFKCPHHAESDRPDDPEAVVSAWEDDESADASASRPAGPTIRYRVRCPDCGYSDRFRSKTNAIRKQDTGCPRCGRGVGVSKVRADPDNQPLIADGGHPAGAGGSAAPPETATDGGSVDVVHADPDAVDAVDPEEFPRRYDPAVVSARNADSSTETVCYADVQVKEGGHIEYVQWDGRTGMIPEWRWCQVRKLCTEYVPETERTFRRVVDEDQRYLPPLAKQQIDDVDRGEGIEADGGWPEGDPCPECGDLMDVGAVGNPGETITWQECEDCNIGWGPFTGYVDTSDNVDRGEGIRTDGGQAVEDPGDFEGSSVTEDAETVAFYQAVCTACAPGSHDCWRGRPFTRESFAAIQSETHQQANGCDAARVRTFETEAIGSLPREKPPVETDDA